MDLFIRIQAENPAVHGVSEILTRASNLRALTCGEDGYRIFLGSGPSVVVSTKEFLRLRRLLFPGDAVTWGEDEPHIAMALKRYKRAQKKAPIRPGKPGKK